MGAKKITYDDHHKNRTDASLSETEEEPLRV